MIKKNISKELENESKSIIQVGLYKFGKAIIPQRFVPNLREFFLTAGYDEVPYSLFSILFILSAIISIFFLYYNGLPMIRSWLFNSVSSNPLRNPVILLIYMLSILGYWFIIQGLIVLTLFLLGYVYYDLKIYNRTKNIERELPEFLSSLSENLKGGLSIEKALWLSIRPDMGDLAYEMRLTAKRVMIGVPTEKALMDLANKYKSPEMKRAFSLINEGIENGSNIAFIVDKLVENMDKTKNLREEMISTNTSYMIFISIIVLFVMPILFAISFELIKIMSNITHNSTLQNQAKSATSYGINFIKISSFKPIGITQKSYLNFSYGALLIAAIFSGILISLILYGNVKGGIKYIILYMIVSAIIYSLVLIGANIAFKMVVPTM